MMMAYKRTAAAEAMRITSSMLVQTVCGRDPKMIWTVPTFNKQQKRSKS